MFNIVRLKHGMVRWLRTYNAEHKNQLHIAKMHYLPFWGKGAKANYATIAHAADIRFSPTGPTQELEDLLFPPSFGELVVRHAKGEVGITEHPAGSNDGPRVHIYQSTTGAYRAAWCASFVRWVYGQALMDIDHVIKWFANPAWVPNWTAAIRAGKLFQQVAFENASKGDVVTLWSSGHIEVVIKRKGDYLHCVGGNTSPVGQNANGGMVALTKRHRSEVTAIGRLRGV